MAGLARCFRLISISPAASTISRSSIYTSSCLLSKERQNPKKICEFPHPYKSSWGRMVFRGCRAPKPDMEYTIEPQKVLKTGGRGKDGEREFRRVGGGLPIVWHMTDRNRITANEQDPKVEVVQQVIPEQTRSAHIALVAGKEKKRWIIATENMQVGDIIKSTREIPIMPVQGKPGDCHPIGALPIGTQVCQIEKFPYAGSCVANAAGVTLQIMEKVGSQVRLKMGSKREMLINEKCLCVVGRNSNVDLNKRKLGSAGAKRDLGYRPGSGKRLKKTGVHGWKNKKPKPAIVYEDPNNEEFITLNFHVSKYDFEKRNHQLHDITN